MIPMKELTKKEIEDLRMPKYCTQVQAWRGGSFSVLKSIDVEDGCKVFHVSVRGLSLTASHDLVSLIFPTLIFEVEEGNDPEIYHFWCDDFEEAISN